MKSLSRIAIVLFAFASTMAKAQYMPMVTEGKYWIYLDNIIHIDALVPIGGHAITFEGDTVVNDVHYKKVLWERLKGQYTFEFTPDYPYQTEDSHLFGYIREDTTLRKVFYLPLNFYEENCDSTEYLLFDFSLAIGDTLHDCLFEFVGGDTTNGWGNIGLIDSIHITERFGRIRNTLFTTGIQTYHGDPPIGELLILEGVGFEWYGIFPSSRTDLVDFCEDQGEYCEWLLSNSAIEKSKPIKVFPNPTQGSFTVTTIDPLPGAICTIIDCMGRVVQSFEFYEATMSAHLDAPGLYFWQVTHRGRVVQSGKIIYNPG